MTKTSQPYILEIRKKCFENESLVRVYKRAMRTGKLDLHVTECEKYNNAIGYPWHPESPVPRANGHFDIEGHSSSDVEGIWYLSPLDLFYWLKCFKDWIKDNVKEGWPNRNSAMRTKPFWRLLAIQSVLDWMYSMAGSYLSYKRPQWIWVVDSFESVKSFVVDETCEAKYPGTGSAAAERWVSGRPEIEKNVTRKHILAWLQENAIQISNGIWVQKVDPTCIYVNNDIILYDMKDGYSDKKLASIIKQWFYLVFGLKLDERLVNG